MKQLISEHPAELAQLGEPPIFSKITDAKGWLSDRLQAGNIPDAQAWIEKYEAAVAQVNLRTSVGDLRAILKDKLKLQLIPDPYPQPFYNYWTPNWLHFWGIIASAALLSLGAPFWFNMLKKLSNLRPILANKEQQERQPSNET